MKPIYKTLLILLSAVVAAGCYEDFDMPAAYPKYESDEEFEAAFAGEGLQRVTIKEVKAQFTKVFGSISGTGSNSSWGNTKTLKFGALTTAESLKASGESGIQAWEAASKYYIKGKVLTDDTQGNFFKSMFIYDGTAAIEIKLTNGIFLNYPQGDWVYVKLDQLYLGNYRMMLSIGEGPTDSYNVVGEWKFYANSNIEDPAQIRSHVFHGKSDVLVDGVDIKVVNKDNYTQLGEDDFGRLIRFEGLTCYYSGVKNHRGETNRVLKNGSYDQIYPSWIDTSVRPIVNKPWYKWAYTYNGVSLYGSVCFTYLSHDELNSKDYYTSHKGIYMVRSSGYSRFAGRPVVRDGAKADITAIYGIYSQQSNYSGNSGDYATYQLSVSSFEDMVFPEGEAAFLTDGTKDTNRDGKIDEHDSNEVLELTPNGYTYDEESGTFVYNSDNDSYFVPSKESSDRTE